jgi:hypothetical protein
MYLIYIIDGIPLSKIILMTKMLKKIKIEGDDHGIGATQ